MRNSKKLLIIYPEKFSAEALVEFHILHETKKKVIVKVYRGIIYYAYGSVFINMEDGFNDIIFVELGIDPNKFCENFLNIKRSGAWPEVESLDMLKKTLKLLEHYDEY